jgi:isoleucyl-tRNA synthetase
MGSHKDTLLLPKTTLPIQANLPTNESARYALWGDVYTRMKRDGEDPFILHDGPPYANGNIHIGHALNKILKDFVVKTAYFSGRAVEFVPGWDCHGLPIEQKVQSAWRLGGPMKKSDSGRGLTPMSMEEASVDFISMCRRYAAEQIAKQKDQFKSLGVVADWENNYETMSPAFEQMIADKLSELRDKGLLVRRRKPVYWSWPYGSALAEAEVEYRERTDKTAYVLFKTDKFPWGLLVWTTTPWTLPANVAVALNPKLRYVAVHVKDQDLPVLVAADTVDALAKKGIVIDTVKGYEAEGAEFEGGGFSTRFTRTRRCLV